MNHFAACTLAMLKQLGVRLPTECPVCRTTLRDTTVCQATVAVHDGDKVIPRDYALMTCAHCGYTWQFDLETLLATAKKADKKS